MFLNKVLLFLLLIIIPFPAFSFSKHNKLSITNINLIQIKDRDYRTIGVMPFFNFTGNDAYSYVGASIQRFATDNLLILNKIKITTNDYIIPIELKTNKLTIFSFSTNLIRNVVILNADDLYKEYLQFPHVDNIPDFASFCHSDYLVYGQYQKNNKSEEDFLVKYKIYNLIQQKDIFNDSIILNIKNVERGVKKISNAVLNFFKEKKTGILKIITTYSNEQILIDNVLVNNSMPQYVVPEGWHNVQIKLLNAAKETNLKIQAGNTNTFYFTNIILNRAILKVNSAPTNAHVFLNLTLLGNTPLSNTNTSIGPYRLQVGKTNYKIFFKNIIVNKGTNSYFVNLQKTLTLDDMRKQNIKNRKTMYWSLGIGAFCMGIAYYCDTESTFDYAKYQVTGDQAQYNKSNEFLTGALVSVLAGAGALTVSFIYFLKVISYDEVNVGMQKIDDFNIVEKNNNNYFLWQHRF